jgi:hypothetical protein
MNKQKMKKYVLPCSKKKSSAQGGNFLRAEDRARTGYPDLGKVVLYQMSYFRIIYFLRALLLIGLQK